MRRKRMVYNWTRNDGWIVGTAYVYGGIYCASHEGVTLIREEEHLGRWSKLKREREIDTKIASDLKCHYWYRNTLVAVEIRKWMGVGIWILIREGFYKLLKIHFEWKITKTKISWKKLLETILFVWKFS
jgi:hypothetical protein